MRSLRSIAKNSGKTFTALAQNIQNNSVKLVSVRKDFSLRIGRLLKQESYQSIDMHKRHPILQTNDQILWMDIGGHEKWCVLSA